MTAAQFDLLPAARLLLAQGADVNARTSATLGHQNFKERSALMYAAENAGMPMIRLVVGAGADVGAVDSAKRDVFNYLSRNETMTAQEREQAAAYLKAQSRKLP
jgi:ankyrin repeat protein